MGVGKIRDIVLMYTPVIFALALMLPRIASPNFGLLDDGDSYNVAKQITSGVNAFSLAGDMKNGRYRPLYWLWFALFYLMFGGNPMWFFVGNAVLLASTVAMIVFLSRKCTGDWMQACLSGVLFALSGPVIESYYTLSKGEPLQLFLLLASLFAISNVSRDGGRARNGIIAAVSAVFVLLAALCAETSLVIIPIASVWLAASLITRQRGRRQDRTVYVAYAISALLGISGALLLRLAAGGGWLTSGIYTNMYVFEASRIATSLSKWALFTVHDFAYAAPLVVAFVAGLLLGRRPSRPAMLFDSLVWAAAWCAIFLPWIFIIEYHMLPFAAGAAFVISIMASDILRWLRKMPPAWKTIVSSCLILSFVLFTLTLLNNARNAQTQLVVDSADARMLDYVANNAPTSATVIINQVDSHRRYEVAQQLSYVRGREDIVVGMIPEGNVSNLGVIDADYIISQRISGQSMTSVRLTVWEPGQKELDSSLQSYMGAVGGWKLAAKYEGGFATPTFDVSSLLCKTVYTEDVCAKYMPLPDTRPFSHGWEIYERA